jgi:hypothetical protein
VLAGGPGRNGGVASAVRVQATLDEGNLSYLELCLAEHADDLAHEGAAFHPRHSDVASKRWPWVEAADAGCCLDDGCGQSVEPVDRCDRRVRAEHVDGRPDASRGALEICTIHCFAHVVDVGLAEKSQRRMPVLGGNEPHPRLVFSGQFGEHFDDIDRWSNGEKQSTHHDQCCRRWGVLNPDFARVQQGDWTLLVETGENGLMQSQHSDMKRRLVLFGLMVLIVALVAGTAFA